MGRKISVISFLLFLSLIGYSKPESIEFYQLSVDKGLPGSNLRKVYQDNIGFMWFGIEAVGLCMYDGKRYIVYENEADNPNSLSNNFVWDIISDKTNLWVATENGLNFFDRNNRKFYRVTSSVKNVSELNDNLIYSLVFDNIGNLWVGHNRGLYKINHEIIEALKLNSGNDSEIISIIDSIDHKSIFAHKHEYITVRNIVLNENNNLYISTNKGMYEYNIDMQKLIEFKSTGKPDDLVHDNLKFIKKINTSKYIIGTDRGGNFFYPKTGKFEPLKFKNIHNGEIDYKGYNDAEIDDNGNLWLAMSEGIVYGEHIGDNYHFRMIKEGDGGLNSKVIRDIFKDQNGLLWIGTKFGGLNIHNIHQQMFKHQLLGVTGNDDLNMIDNYVLSFFEDREGDFWIGSKFSGLLTYNVKTGKVAKKFKFSKEGDLVSASRVECINQLKNGDIITGTSNGVTLYSKTKGWLKNIPFSKISCITRDSRGNLWVGALSGIYLFNEKEHKLLKYTGAGTENVFSNNNIHVNKIYEDSAGNLWIGTFENGIYVYMPHKGTIVHHFHNKENHNSLSGDMVRDIQEDKKGRIWVATKHAGLCFFNWKTGYFKRYTKADGLPSNTIYSIVEDYNDNLWLGTHYGLSLLNIDNITFTNFDINHGLQSNIFENDAKLVSRKGLLFFGGKNGFNVFNPDSINVKTTKAKIAITSFNVDEKMVLCEFLRDTSIILNHDQNYISFEFALLDYRNPSKTEYKFMLEGVDKKWIESGDRNYISYPKLSAGKYTFNVLARNQDNIWSDPISIKVLILPSFWNTKIAYLLYFILILVLIFVIYNLATLRINYINRLNEANSQINRSTELNRIKLHFFTNISHELRTPLSLILAPLENLLKSNNLSLIDRKNVELVNINSKRLHNLINQLLYFRKTEQTSSEMKVFEYDIVSFVKEVTVPYKDLSIKKKIEFNINSSIDSIMLWFDPDKMEKIVSNLLMNAFKFTPEEGEITIDLSVEKNEEIIKGKYFGKDKKHFLVTLIIKISDTGSGMTKDQMKQIFDRFYVGDDNKKGIGVGLELTRTLVELHGGEINVESEPGVGSDFYLRFPVGTDNYNKESISTQKIKPKDYVSEIDHDLILSDSNIEYTDEIINMEKEEDDNKPLLLIVDDNKDLRYFLSINLSNQFNVLTAEDGNEGLLLAKEKIPELILSDVMMPVMDGIEMCRLLKSDITTSHIPIILLTAKTHIENKLEGMAIGADDYIEKPFNFQFLQLRILNLLRSRHKLRDQILQKISNNTEVELKISEYDKKFLDNCKSTIEENYADPKFSVVELSKLVGMSRSQLHRKLKALAGNSPIEWIYNFRLEKAREMLKDKKYNVSDVAYLTGFNSPSSFSTVFRKKFGQSPSEITDTNAVKK